MNKPPRDKSYNDVMNEWSAQRSFINQMRSRIVHPPYDAPWYGKLWGYLWRLSVVVGLFLLVSYTVLKTRMRSSGFRAHLAEEVSKRYKATNVTCGATEASFWSKDCTIKAMGADGAPGSFFNRLDAYQLSFDLGEQFLRTDWHLKLLSINQLDLNLRSGTFDPNAAPSSTTPEVPKLPDRVVVPEFKTSNAGAPSKLRLAGFGISPNFKELTISAYEVKQLNLRWGYGDTTAGKLEGANSVLNPTDNHGWIFTATSGELSQNWLSGLKVREFEAVVEDSLVFKKASFVRGAGEKLELSGSMSLGELPQLDLTVRAQGLNLKTLTPPAFSGYFDAAADVDGKILGTINRLSGVKTQLRVKLVSTSKEVGSKAATGGVAWLKNLPVFRSLYVASGEDALVQPVVTKGSFNLETGEGSMRISSLDLECGDLLRIRGELECTESQAPSKLMDGVQGIPVPIYSLNTNLQVGVKSDLVKGMPRNIQEAYFKQEAEGMRWMPLKLVGEKGSSLTQSLAEEISRLQKESLMEKGL